MTELEACEGVQSLKSSVRGIRTGLSWTNPQNGIYLPGCHSGGGGTCIDCGGSDDPAAVR